MLGRDVTDLAGGPLSQYFHALVFKLFGVSFTALIVTSLVLLALFVGMLYGLFVRAADRWTAVMACLTTLCVFSFSQYVATGNYNYVCPYSYEAFHGLVLSVAAIACLWRWIAVRRGPWAFAAGCCAGCVSLTKPDLFLALAAALAAGGLIARTGRTDSQPTPDRMPVMILLGLAAPVVAFITYFGMVWKWDAGAKAVAGSWLPLLTTRAAQNSYYRWCLGLDHPAAKLLAMLQYFGGSVLLVALLALFARCFQRRNLPAVIGLGGALTVLLFAGVSRFHWLECGIALLPATLLGCVFIGRRWWETRHSAEGESLVFPLLWSVFALFLLAKLGLNTRFAHYGFYLAMPATLFMVFLIIRLLPCELERFQVHPVAFRVLATVFIAVGLARLVGEANRCYRAKNFTVGEGADRIISYDPKVDATGYAMQYTVSWLQKNTLPTDTLAVLPEGALINFLTRRTNPTPFLCLTPSEIAAYGEKNILAAFARALPDYILLIHRDSREYGVKYFGLEPGYGYDIMQWILANYSTVWLIGHEPLQTNRFGIKLLKRNDLGAASARGGKSDEALPESLQALKIIPK